MKALGITFLIVLAAACGGGGVAEVSGVDQSKATPVLETGEIETFCDWAIDLNGGEAVETPCGDDAFAVSWTRAECIEEIGQIPASCDGLTVGELEACVHDLADDPCGFGSAACAEYIECGFGQ